jgi:ACT domain-containing protein
MSEIMTIEMIKNFLSQKEIDLPAGTVVTKSAIDWAKEHGLKISVGGTPVAEDATEIVPESRKAIISVIGVDKVGIIAKVSGILAEKNINILDISQTIIGGFFTMTMMVDLEKSTSSFSEIKQQLNDAGKDIGVQIIIQDVNVFQYMHRL